MGKVTLVTGGVRSGKSDFALELCSGYERKAYLATAEAFDREMRERIRRHKVERGDEYITVEEPLELAKALREVDGCADCVVVECLTTWTANLIHHLGDLSEVDSRIRDFLEALETFSSDVIVVTNEVGWGVVPPSESSRRYVEILGRLNRSVARLAREVYLVVSGVPVKIKEG